MSVASVDVPVLIVGGSLVGMSSAALLARAGVKTLVVERHRGSAIHPRAAMIYQRTMEIVRNLGIEETVRTRSYEQFEPDGAIMSVESIAGDELNWDIPHLNEHVRDLSPVERLFISQNALEPMLRERAAQYGADLRYNTELVSFTATADGVTAQIRERDSGAETVVHAQYMIAADGNRSAIRDQLAIPMSGPGVLSKSLTIYFRADVAPLMRGRNLSVILVRNPAFRGFFRIEKPYRSGFLIVHTIGDPDAPDENAWSLDERRCAELLRIGLGADIPVAIDSIQKWECAALVADQWRIGRILLAGDAAHVMPPYGGFGGNTGIQDAQNLAWKLALVVAGHADPALLDTYQAERRPVAAMTMEQAYLRYVLRGASYLAGRGLQVFVPDPQVDLGYGYRSDAIVSDGDEAPLYGDPRTLHARPGTRAPHVAIDQYGDHLSTLDFYGRGFVLMTGREGRAWREIAADLAHELRVDIDVHHVGTEGMVDPQHRFEPEYGITPTGAVLVRPDAMVGWRAAHAGEDAALRLREAMLRILHLPRPH